MDLVLDADPFLDTPDEPAGDVLRVLEKGAKALRHDPREVASQLYGRLGTTASGAGERGPRL